MPTRDKAHSLANELCVMLQDNPDRLGELAREFSDCPSRQVDGNLGQLSLGSTVSEFERALLTMKVGEISGQPVETKFGFHIIALDRKIEGKILPYEQAKVRLKGWLEASSWSKAVSQYITIIASAADVRGIDLDKVESPLIQ